MICALQQYNETAKLQKYETIPLFFYLEPEIENKELHDSNSHCMVQQQ